MESERADCLVWFGCTGDLGLKMTFPALFRMERRGVLDVPIVGVALSEWTVEDLTDRARESIAHYGGGTETDDDQAALDRLVGRLHYISGDYTDQATFVDLGRRLKQTDVADPVYYLAIPPDLFEEVISHGPWYDRSLEPELSRLSPAPGVEAASVTLSAEYAHMRILLE